MKWYISTCLDTEVMINWLIKKQEGICLWNEKMSIKYVSHPGGIKHKTLFVKNELNTFSDRGYLYGHNEKKLFKYFKNELNGEENKSIYQKNTVLRYIWAFKVLG